MIQKLGQLTCILFIGILVCGCTSAPSSEQTTVTTEPEQSIPAVQETIVDQEEIPGEKNETAAWEDNFMEEFKRIDQIPVTPITMKIGTTTLISLKENPTTGYTWNATISSGLMIINDTYSRSAGTAAIGGGGEHTWIVKGTGTGNQTFSAVYRRPWEKPSPDDLTYSQPFIITEDT